MYKLLLNSAILHYSYDSFYTWRKYSAESFYKINTIFLVKQPESDRVAFLNRRFGMRRTHIVSQRLTYRKLRNINSLSRADKRQDIIHSQHRGRTTSYQINVRDYLNDRLQWLTVYECCQVADLPKIEPYNNLPF